MEEKILNQEKVYDPARKLFEFKSDEKFWIVASSIEEAEKCLKEDYEEVDLFEDEDRKVREITRDEHFEIIDEGIDGEDQCVDIWNMIDRDAADTSIKIPYMAATSLV